MQSRFAGLSNGWSNPRAYANHTTLWDVRTGAITFEESPGVTRVLAQYRLRAVTWKTVNRALQATAGQMKLSDVGGGGPLTTLLDTWLPSPQTVTMASGGRFGLQALVGGVAASSTLAALGDHTTAWNVATGWLTMDDTPPASEVLVVYDVAPPLDPCAPDLTPPVLVCAATANVECGSAASAIVATAADTCGVTVLASTAPAAFTAATSVTFTATDASGNQALCTTAVTVADTTAPTLTCPAPETIECAGVLTAYTPAAAKAVDACDGTSSVAGSTASYPRDRSEIVFQHADAAGNTGTCTTSVTVIDTVAPSISCPPDVTVRCAPAEGVPAAQVGLGTGVATDACDPSPTITALHALAVYPPGDHVVTFEARDAAGHAAQCNTTVHVQPGAATAVVPRRVRLWPPEHQYVEVDLAQCIASVSGCGQDTAESIARSARITRYGADEDELGQGCGSGRTRCDLGPLSNRRVRARAERSGRGNGRVYTIEYAYTDESGQAGQASCQLEVPHAPSDGPVQDDGYAWSRTAADPACTATCGRSLSLDVSRFQGSGTSLSSPRVFVGRTERVGNADVALRGPSGEWLKDDVDLEHVSALNLPHGAFFVARLGDGRVLLGTWGFMREGKGKASWKVVARTQGGALRELRNYGPAPFERQGDGQATFGNAGQDEATLGADGALTLESTVSTHADFVVVRANCADSDADDEGVRKADDDERREDDERSRGSDDEPLRKGDHD